MAVKNLKNRVKGYLMNPTLHEENTEKIINQ